MTSNFGVCRRVPSRVSAVSFTHNSNIPPTVLRYPFFRSVKPQLGGIQSAHFDEVNVCCMLSLSLRRRSKRLV